MGCEKGASTMKEIIEKHFRFIVIVILLIVLAVTAGQFEWSVMLELAREFIKIAEVKFSC